MISKIKEIISNTFRTQSSIPNKAFAKIANSHRPLTIFEILHPNCNNNNKNDNNNNNNKNDNHDYNNKISNNKK